MSNPLQELVSLVAKETTYSGVVSLVAKGTASVVTASGVKEVAVPATTSISVGSTVTISNGNITGVVLAGVGSITYTV